MATSYLNTGGQGDRTAIITVTSNFTPQGLMSNAVDGASGNNGTDSFGFQSGVNSGNTITFDFGVNAHKIIDEFKWVQQTSATQGTWKWAWSDDNSAYTDLTTGIAIAGASSTTTVTVATVAAGARYYRLIQTSGSTDPSPWIQEVTFKIDDAPGRSAVAAQTMAAFSNAFAAVLVPISKAVASQIINDFPISSVLGGNIIHVPRVTLDRNSVSAGARPRRVR